MPKSRAPVRRGLSVICLLLAVSGGGRAAGATEVALPCPEGNLLAGRRPSAVQGLSEDSLPSVVTDGFALPSGSPLGSVGAVRFVPQEPRFLVFDLDRAIPLRTVYVQADANDVYRLDGSDDGLAYRPLAEVPPLDSTGLRGRWVMLAGTPTRFLRLGVAHAQGGTGLSEIQAFCTLPQPFPPQLPVSRIEPPPRRWGDDLAGPLQLALALVGLGLVVWEIELRRSDRTNFLAQTRTAGFVVLAVLAAGTYINFGKFHGGQVLHHHDLAHYVLGARYFPELGYENLYVCATVADAEAGLESAMKTRRVREVHSNLLLPAKQVLAHPERCRARFSPARWQAFGRDVAVFRAALGPQRWNDWFEDHGYNPPPVWMVVARPLLALGPSSVSHGFLLFLASLDLLLLLGALGLVGRAFGLRTLAVVLLVLGTNFAGQYAWTGGAFLRFDWLALCLGGVSLLKLGRPASAGFMLAYAALLRLFPVFLLLGPLARLVRGWRRRGRPEPADLRLALGAGGGLVLLLALGALTAGPSSYIGFAANTWKHGETPVSNHMGLPVVLAYRPSQVARLVQDEGLRDPYAPWMELRRQAARQMRPVHLGIALAAVVCFGLVASTLSAWAAAALCAALAAFGPQLGCYYYVFLVVVALLYAERPAVGAVLLAFCAASQYLAWAPFGFLPVWYDELYFAISVLVLIALSAVGALMRKPASTSRQTQ